MAWKNKKTSSAKPKKAKFSESEKLAFKTGSAYRLGKEGRKINFKNEKTKSSFSAGYKGVKLSNYPKIGAK